MSRREKPAPDSQETVRRATREEALKSVTMGIKLSSERMSVNLADCKGACLRTGEQALYRLVKGNWES